MNEGPIKMYKLNLNRRGRNVKAVRKQAVRRKYNGAVVGRVRAHAAVYIERAGRRFGSPAGPIRRNQD